MFDQFRKRRERPERAVGLVELSRCYPRKRGNDRTRYARRVTDGLPHMVSPMATEPLSPEINEQGVNCVGGCLEGRMVMIAVQTSQ